MQININTVKNVATIILFSNQNIGPKKLGDEQNIFIALMGNSNKNRDTIPTGFFQSMTYNPIPSSAFLL